MMMYEDLKQREIDILFFIKNKLSKMAIPLLFAKLRMGLM